LIEMLVVLTIIGLVAAVAVTMLPRSGGSLQHGRQATRLANMIAEARFRAALTGQPVNVDLSGSGGSDETGSANVSAKERSQLMVYPDGSNSGSVVEGTRGWTVDWLTGTLHENR